MLTVYPAVSWAPRVRAHEFFVTTEWGPWQIACLCMYFYPRDAMLARSLRQRRVCLSVCLSGRLSHAGIVPSRAKAGS